MLLRLTLALALLAAAPAAAHQADRWESKPSAPLPRQEAALAELDGKLYFAGGFEASATESARVDVYDIAKGTWSPAAPMPEPAHHGAAVGLGGKLYFLGGLQTIAFSPTGRVWVYDPALGQWSLGSRLPAGRERGAGAVAVHDGRIIYAGGVRVVVKDGRPQLEVSSAVDRYDPRTNEWTTLPDMPTGRDHFGVGVVGDTLYAVGGRKGGLRSPVTATEALDLKKLEWRSGLAPIPTPRGGFATAVVGREIITIGGESPSTDPSIIPGNFPYVHAHDEVEAYHPGEDRWRSMSDMPEGRYGMQGAVHGGGIWLAGGGLGMTVDTTGALDVFYPGQGPGSPH